MAKRLSPQEVERLKRQEKLVAELKKILYQNYTYAIQLPEVRKAIEQGNEDFSFFKNKIAERELRKFLLRNSEAINVTIINAIKEEWQYVDDNHWKGMRTVFSKDYQKLKVYEAAKNNAENYVRNTAAENLKFVTQTRQGVKFSDRVWNISDKVIPEMDILVQNAIKEGKSAAEVGRELRKFLNEPERIFRRVRNKKTGELELSETAKQYHPGQGVYRSSVKNAERLARTEINVAYRYSEWLAYQSNELIIGYEIKVSNNSENRCQTCVDLQGIYPKWFLWTSWHPQCYSDDTELMTNNGWKLFEDLEKNDLIFSLNPETKQPEWVRFTKFIKYHRKGKMYRFHNRNLDMLVTPDHKMVYLNKTDGKTIMDNKIAENFTPNTGGLYRSSEYEAKSIDKIQIGNHDIDFNLFVEFMAYYLSEGNLFWTRKNQIKISKCKVKHRQQYEIIKSCLEKMPFNFSEIQGGFYFNDKSFYQYLKQFGKSPEKHIPEIIKNSSKEQMRLFLDAYVICDGYTKKAKSFVGNRGGLHTPKNDEKTYFTSSKRMVADIGELLVKIGKRPSYRFSAKKGDIKTHRNGDYITNNDNIIISECNSKTATAYQKTEVDYDGFVYDIELEKNHIFYVRRNGKCVWGSNCRCRMIPVTLNEADLREKYRSILLGTEFKPKQIVDLPENFKAYLRDNAERIANAKSTPYWYQDNEARVKKALSE